MNGIGADREPIDMVARRVIRRGYKFGYEQFFDHERKHWDIPPPIRKSVPNNIEQFVGHSFGRLTVIGVYLHSKKHKLRWVVRCVCGKYELRKLTVLKKSSDKAKCQSCTIMESNKHTWEAYTQNRWV